MKYLQFFCTGRRVECFLLLSVYKIIFCLKVIWKDFPQRIWKDFPPWPPLPSAPWFLEWNNKFECNDWKSVNLMGNKSWFFAAVAGRESGCSVSAWKNTKSNIQCVQRGGSSALCCALLLFSGAVTAPHCGFALGFYLHCSTFAFEIKRFQF